MAAAPAAAAAVAGALFDGAAVAAGLATPTLVQSPSAVPYPVVFVGLSLYLFRDLFLVRCSLLLVMIAGVALIDPAPAVHN